jgi:hypothetical protein
VWAPELELEAVSELGELGELAEDDELLLELSELDELLLELFELDEFELDEFELDEFELLEVDRSVGSHIMLTNVADQVPVMAVPPVQSLSTRTENGVLPQVQNVRL